MPLDDVLPTALAFGDGELWKKRPVVQHGRSIDPAVIRDDERRDAAAVRVDQGRDHLRCHERHVGEHHDRRVSGRLGRRPNAGPQRAVHATRELRIRHRPVRQAFERPLNEVGLVTEDDEQRIEACLRRAFDHLTHERLAVELQEQLVPAHTSGGARRQDDPGDRSGAFSRHGWRSSFRAGVPVAAVQARPAVHRQC